MARATSTIYQRTNKYYKYAEFEQIIANVLQYMQKKKIIIYATLFSR